ncbi:MAG: hypothetical protein O3A36_01270 [bacterium]|nr:hypothetical protein [bacterium]
MLLKTKLAFEIWSGIVLLIVVIGGVAGFTLISGNDLTPLLTKSQVNTQTEEQAPASSLLLQSDILNVATSISDVVSGGTP